MSRFPLTRSKDPPFLVQFVPVEEDAARDFGRSGSLTSPQAVTYGLFRPLASLEKFIDNLQRALDREDHLHGLGHVVHQDVIKRHRQLQFFPGFPRQSLDP